MMLAGLHQISEFNTRPHIPLSNASSAASRPPSHGSGPGWFAIPYLYDFFHHCSTPVYPDAIPAALLALLSELTRFVSSHRELLLPGFRRFGRPPRRRISLRCQLGNLHRRDSHPLEHRLASLHYPGALLLADHPGAIPPWSESVGSMDATA